MRAARRMILALLAVALVAPAALLAQDDPAGKDDDPYGGTPEPLRPYRGVGEPARRFFVDPPTFRGPGRDDVAPEGLTEVAIGMVAPLL